MTRIFNDVKLKFDAEVEYSTNGGTTWVTLPANTEAIVDGADITNSQKVMVRSTAQDITLNKTDLEWDTKAFSTINIKNGEALTDLTNVFKNMNVKDTLQLINIPRVTSLYAFCAESTINNVILGKLPDSCVNICWLGHTANINYFSSVKLSGSARRLGMFYHANINYLGDVSVDSPNITSSIKDASGREFYRAVIDSMGRLTLASNNKDGYTSSSYTSMCYYLDTPYILSGEIKIQNSHQYLNFSKTQLVFTGLNFEFIDAYAHNEYASIRDNSKLIYPFSSVYKNKGEFSKVLYNTPNLTEDMPTVLLSEFKSNSTNNKSVELSKYLPDCVVLHNHISTHVKDKISIGAKGLYYYMYSGGAGSTTQTVNNKVQPLKLMSGLQISAVTYSPIVYVCRNGVYGSYNEGVVTVFNNSDVQIGTITSSTIVGANFNQVGTVLLTANGGTVDTSSTDDQTISSSIILYNTTTGESINTVAMPDKVNTEVVGVYQPTSDSNMHVLYNRYEVSDGTMTLVESYIDTYLYGNFVTKTVLPNTVDYITNHYAEDNEFNCIDRSTGRVIRCFGA